MYNAFYELQREPFHVTPDPEFLFPSPAHKEALAAIIYGIEQRKGFVAITGEVGVGKTTILRSYLDFADRQNLKLIYVYNSNLTFDELITTLLQELDIPDRPPSTFQAVTRLHEALIEVYRKNQTVVLIIDEAQNMPVETLESLRMLSNLETVTEKLIQIMLIGQPEFDELLQQHRLRQLRQRIAIHARIGPLNVEDSMAYLEHRLAKVALGSRPVFTRNALKLIAEASEGIPRNLNIISDNALITGYGYQQRPVNTKIIREVLADRGLGAAPPAPVRSDKRRSGLWIGGGLAAAAAVALVAGVLALHPDLMRRGEPQFAQMQPPAQQRSAPPPAAPRAPEVTAASPQAPEAAPSPAPAEHKPPVVAEPAPPPPPPRVASNPPPERPQLLDRPPAAPPAAQPAPAQTRQAPPRPVERPQPRPPQSAPAAPTAPATQAAPSPVPSVPRSPEVARAPSVPREAPSTAARTAGAAPEPPQAAARATPSPTPAPTPSESRVARSGSPEPAVPVVPPPQPPASATAARRSPGPIPLAPPPRPTTAQPAPAARPTPSIIAGAPAPAAPATPTSVMMPSASGSGVAASPPVEVADAAAAARPLVTPPAPSGRTVKAVRVGDSLWTMAEEVYGFVSPTILRRVQDANPQIRNINVLAPGQEVVFPRVQETPFDRGTAVSDSVGAPGRN